MNSELERFRDFIALVLLLLPIFDWTAVWILRRAIKHAPVVSVALKERFVVALLLAITVSMNALIGLVVLLDITLPPGIALAILASSLVMVSAPNLYWLYLYGSNRIKK